MMATYCIKGQDENHSVVLDYIHLLAITMILHRGTKSFLVLFDSTRYMIKLIIESITAMVPFAIVTLSLMVALAVSYFQLKKIEM